MSSNFVGASILIFALGLISFLISGHDAFLTIVFFGLAMMLPLGRLFQPSRPIHLLKIYTALMALIGIGAIIIAFIDDNMINGLSMLFLICFVIFQWMANYIAIKRNNP